MYITELRNMLSGLRMNAEKCMLVTTHNACNAYTPGFKKSVICSKDLFYENLKSRLNTARLNRSEDNELAHNNIVQLGKGSDISSITRIHNQGPLQSTGRNFDFAIKGEGYFRVELDRGYAYTRAGHFNLSADGKSFVTDQGHKVDANVDITQEDLKYGMEIDSDSGSLKGGKNKDKVLASFNLYNFQNQEKLEATGDNLFVATEQSGESEAIQLNDPYSAKIENNALEGANIDLYSILKEMHESKELHRLMAIMEKCLNEISSFQGNI